MDTTPHSRGGRRPRFALKLSPERGSRECRMRAAPEVSCASWVESARMSIQGSGGNPTFPARCSTDYIVLTPAIWLVVTVACEYGCQSPVGMTGLRRLDAGRCGVRPTRFHRTQLHRSSARPGRSQVTKSHPPCDHVHAPDAARVHRSPPRVSDDPDTPLELGRDGGGYNPRKLSCQARIL